MGLVDCGGGVALAEAYNKVGADLQSRFLTTEKRSKLSVSEGIHWKDI